ncbi:hypothetical protein AV654_25095 [Paenibacillus elgii]|uniref:Uncharacterized protein n=1 Tax=Paenibacillus elgii TaxID=189691 RepID=A0A163W2G0_9BACL|nr:hypothetical protein AV654_25095 [Paenibacillus elgii]
MQRGTTDIVEDESYGGYYAIKGFLIMQLMNLFQKNNKKILFICFLKNMPSQDKILKLVSWTKF